MHPIFIYFIVGFILMIANWFIMALFPHYRIFMLKSFNAFNLWIADLTNRKTNNKQQHKPLNKVIDKSIEKNKRR